MNLSTLICNAFDTSSRTDIYKSVFSYAISYLSGGYSAFEFQSLVKPMCIKISAKVFRLSLLKHKNIHFGIKLVLLELSLMHKPSKQDFRAIIKRIDVDAHDAVQAYAIWQTQPAFRRRLAKDARRMNRVRDISEDETIQVFNRVYPSILSYVKFISYKKLRFLAKSSNCELTDLHSELTLKVAQAFYRLLPSDQSESYITNYLKRVAHNHAMNMIQSNTTKRSGRLVNLGVDSNQNNIYSLVVVSENQLNVASVGDEQVSYEHLGEDNQMEKFELSFSLVQLLDKYKSKQRKYRFLQILTGVHDEQFTEWLVHNKKCKPSDTNVDLQMTTPSDLYLSWLCSYMHIGQDSANVFLLKVKKELGFDYSQHRKCA